jgi:formate/nitrite transporter FocA (FNT family)
MTMALHRSLVLALSALVLSTSGLQTSSLINKQASPLINKRPRNFAALATTTDATFTETVVRGGGNNDNFSLLDSPADAFFALAAKGEASAKMSVAKTFSAAILGGLYVGVGGMLSLAVSGNMPGVAATNPGLIKLTFAALFPVALFLCLQGGAQLFTGNTATMSAAFFEKKVTLKDVLRNWVIAYGGNLIGCAGFAAACSYSGVLTGGAATMASNMAVAKTSMTFGPLVVRAIFCNWLVCLAVFCAAQAKDMMGKYM